MLQELGLIFGMDNLEVIEMSKSLADKYCDSLSYSDVAGIRQLQFIKQMKPKQVLDMYYE